MRIAIFSDIHGNSTGLDAVLADIEAKGGVDGYWVLGDHVASGPDPAGVMERLLTLQNAEFIHGNTDRYVFSDAICPPYAEDVASDLSLLPQYAEIHGNFGWTTGIMAQLGFLDWLMALPFSISMTLPNGIKLQGVHSTPWDDNDLVGFCPKMTEETVEKFAADCDADYIFCGHTHFPWEAKVDGKTIMNVGSVGLPRTKSLGACWTLLTMQEQDCKIEQFNIPFDRQAVMQAVIDKRQPGVKFINGIYEGERIYPWKEKGEL